MSDLLLPEIIEIGNTKYEMTQEADLAIQEVNLNYEYCRQAALFARYGTAYELALHAERKLKTALELTAARLDHQGRMEAKTAGVKQTEKMAESYVKDRVDFQDATEEFQAAQKITGLLKQAKDAIVQKQNMLMQLGATQRQERGSDPTMKAEHIKNSS